MLIEKMVAVSKVGRVIVDQWSEMVVDASEEVSHFSLGLAGPPTSAGELATLTERWLAHSTRMIAPRWLLVDRLWRRYINKPPTTLAVWASRPPGEGDGGSMFSPTHVQDPVIGLRMAWLRD